jgi:riboflavin biosynthesis pyrimidine reductase
VNLYRVIPQPSEVYNLESKDSRQALAKLYTPEQPSSVRAVMVTNSAGETVSPEGSSSGLSRGSDRALLAVLRESADVVIVGATTIRNEPVPLPRTTPLAVLSASGDLRHHHLNSRGSTEERLIIATPSGSKHSLDVALGGLPWEHLPWDPTVSPQVLIGAVRQLIPGAHVLVEGGRMTWEYLAPLTTELLIATTPPPRDQHQGIPPWWSGDVSQWELASLLTDDAKMLYYRQVLRSAARPGV